MVVIKTVDGAVHNIKHCDIPSFIEENHEQIIEFSKPEINPRRCDSSIDHPEHYGGDRPYECIKVLEHWLTDEEMEGALKFNVFKYLQRYPKKHGIRDLKKAYWYLGRLISHLEARSSDTGEEK